MTTNCNPCNITTTPPIESTGNCVDETVLANQQLQESNNMSCVTINDGKTCPENKNCSPWDISEGPEDCLINDLIEQQLDISGVPLKVHKLLGVHEQGLVQDVTGLGAPMSSGSLPNNPSSNAFDKFITEWRSLQTGSNVTKDAYIGYDFGPIKLDNGRLRYGLDTAIQRDISTIKLMQGCDAKNRATKIRVERSFDGEKWYGVAVLNVQDCDGLVTLNFKRTVPSRYWRIRPITFNGTSTDYWSVKVLQFIEYEATHITNIQDKLLLENRDRDYQEYAIEIKAQYTPQEFSTQFNREGFNAMLDVYSFDVSFKQAVQRLGRPFVIGDIIMLPSERQFSASMRPIDKYLEVTDAFWSSNGFTPLWTPTMQKIIAKPILASQETQDIVGKLTKDIDESGLFDIDDGNDGKIYQDYSDIGQNFVAQNKNNVPVKGVDYADSPIISKELKEYAKNRPNMNVDKFERQRLVTGVDAMPPNGLPYSEGDRFPDSPSNGDYHRLTYTEIGTNIPARLYKYSAAKGRWMYLETDRKVSINSNKPFLTEYLSTDSSSKTELEQIDEKLKNK